MRLIDLKNLSRPLSTPLKVVFCQSFLCRFRGLMMQPSIQPDRGLLLVEEKESTINTAIHMFFMRFDIAAIWINAEQQVVDAKIACRWHPFYIPRYPARFILETHPERLADFQPGDQLSFVND